MDKALINRIIEFTAKKNVPMEFKHIDTPYSALYRERVSLTLEELLNYINSDRSNQWTPYDESDWYEGMIEWTDLRIVEEFT